MGDGDGWANPLGLKSDGKLPDSTHVRYYRPRNGPEQIGFGEPVFCS
jgi:hypothetical protein